MSTIFSTKRIERKLAAKKAHADRVRVKLTPAPDAPSRGIYDNKVFKFNVKKGSKEVLGTGTYGKADKAVYIDYVGDKKTHKIGTTSATHEKIKNKAMDPAMIKGALKKLKKIFPKAETVEGGRITGAHTKGTKSNQVFNIGARVGKLAKGLKVLGPIGEIINLPETRRQFMGRRKQKENYRKWGTIYGGKT